MLFGDHTRFETARSRHSSSASLEPLRTEAITDSTLKTGSRPAKHFAQFVCGVLIGFSCIGMARADDGFDYFERKVRTVLVEHCYKCHSAESKELKGELRLDIKAGWQLGGESGEPAIVPGDTRREPTHTRGAT